ncbi:unnamed protein product [Ectocarpus sp. CCAP 1310/34]|nr:unnamed protein product [Ectocarpus sp. CCAP 1310/34]
MKPGDGKGSERAKPKFRPKAQARKKPAPPPPPVTDYRGAAANYRSGGGAGAGEHGGERGGRGRGRGGFVPVGQDFFVGGGGSGPAAYMPAGVTPGGDGGGGGRRGGGDTSESEDEQDRKRSSHSRKSGPGGRAVKEDAEGGGSSSAAGLKGPASGGSGGAGEEEDDDENMFGVGESVSKGGGGKEGDVLTLIGSDVGRRSRSSKLPGMRVTGNVMSEDDSMRPVALPVTATAQTPGSRLFAQANNQAELTEEEDSSLFFVQLPTKLPRPLAAFQRGKDGASAPVRGKGKGKATGGPAVKEEAGESGAGGAAAGATGGKGKGAAAEKASEIPADDVAFDQGLRRMRPGKIGKLYVHQSGKARLVIGGVSLVVHPGLPVSFVEQGVSIDAKQKTFCSFGQVTKRAVCTPDFEQLYRRADEISGGGGGGEDGFEGGAGAGGDVGGPSEDGDDMN